MPDWKRFLAGDAFRLPSGSFNYYRDSVLMWPFLVFSIVALANLLTSGGNHRLGIKCSVLALTAILFAKERLLLLLGALGFCAVQSFVSFVLRKEPVALATALTAGIVFVLLIRTLRDYKSSYERSRGLKVVDLLVSVCSLGLSLALLYAIR